MAGTMPGTASSCAGGTKWALDAGWISIDNDYKILVREDLPDHQDYRFVRGYEGERIHLPVVAEAAPDIIYLREHRKLTGFD